MLNLIDVKDMLIKTSVPTGMVKINIGKNIKELELSNIDEWRVNQYVHFAEHTHLPYESSIPLLSACIQEQCLHIFTKRHGPECL